MATVDMLWIRDEFVFDKNPKTPRIIRLESLLALQ